MHGTRPSLRRTLASAFPRDFLTDPEIEIDSIV
jgi:hypothetical protein